MQKKSFIRAVSYVLLTAILMSVFGIPRTNATSAMLLGDVNRDGTVNPGDVVSLLRYFAGLDELGDDAKLCADVNKDKKHNVADAVALLRFLSGEDVSNEIGRPISLESLDVGYEDLDYEQLEINSQRLINITEDCSYAETPLEMNMLTKGYEIKIDKSGRYAFETSIANEQQDTFLYLIDESGVVMLHDDDGGDNRFSRIEIQAWGRRTFKLLVCVKNAEADGEFYINAYELVQIPSPTETPVSTSAPVTPSPTPTQSPTPTPSPTPTQSPKPTISVDAPEFINESVPGDNRVYQFGKSRSLLGYIESNEPIKKVMLFIYDHRDELETAASYTVVSDSIYNVSLSDGGASSIDNQIAFADLCFGDKSIVIKCNVLDGESYTVYSDEFFVGATDNMLVGNVYNSGSTPLNSSQRAAILNHLNSLNPNAIGDRVVHWAYTLLGTPYGVGTGQHDCSSTTQYAYRQEGISIPRTAAEQGRFCYELNGEIPRSDLIEGDLVFFQEKGCSCGRYHEIHHVAMYVGTINGKRYYIESSYSLRKVVLRMAWGETESSRWKIDFYSRPY